MSPSPTLTREGGNPWQPCLKGILRPPDYEDALYQPLAFLTSDTPHNPPNSVWFTYYKDMRESGGRLKMGHGPGGPPVFGATDVIHMLGRMIDLNCLESSSVKKAFRLDA